MRIVHAANFSYNHDGRAFANPDQKLQHGFVENGHFCYAFPVNDIARQMSWRNSKSGGKNKANQSLIETCRKVQADVLVLGHARLITLETLEKIKTFLPQIKIIQWFVDPLEYKRVYQFILDRLPVLDAVFLTTGGEYLDLFKTDSCQAHFFPNPVHAKLERHKAFQSKDYEYDLIFIGDDTKDPARRELLTEINEQLSAKFKLGIFGSLGNPRIHGKERDSLFQRSKASLNLTRHKPMTWYSSDRISQLMGNGLLTCTRSEAALDNIYGEDALLFYKTKEELINKLDEAFSSGSWRETAQIGWEFIHANHNTKKVTQKMLQSII